MLHLTPTMTQNHQLIQNQKPSESPEEVEALPQPSAPQLASVVTQPEPIVIETKETPAMTEDTNKQNP